MKNQVLACLALTAMEIGASEWDPLAVDFSKDVNSFCAHVPVERALFGLGKGEPLHLRVFVDGPVVEVFANGRQAISRRVYPREGLADGVRLTAIGGPVAYRTLRTWEIMPSNVD